MSAHTWASFDCDGGYVFVVTTTRAHSRHVKSRQSHITNFKSKESQIESWRGRSAREGGKPKTIQSMHDMIITEDMRPALNAQSSSQSRAWSRRRPSVRCPPTATTSPDLTPPPGSAPPTSVRGSAAWASATRGGRPRPRRACAGIPSRSTRPSLGPSRGPWASPARRRLRRRPSRRLGRLRCAGIRSRPTR